MPTLEARDIVTVLTGVLTLSGMIAALRNWVSKLQAGQTILQSGQTTLQTGQTELLRQLAAVHKRMDIYGERLTRAERSHAVLVERVANLRESQRFKLRAQVEAAAIGEPPILAGAEEEDT